MLVHQVSSRGITFGAENSGKGDTTIVGKLAQVKTHLHALLQRLIDATGRCGPPPAYARYEIKSRMDNVCSSTYTRIQHLIPPSFFAHPQGSHGIQERLPVDKSNSITFGAEKLGVGDTKILTKVDSLRTAALTCSSPGGPFKHFLATKVALFLYARLSKHRSCRG